MSGIDKDNENDSNKKSNDISNLFLKKENLEIKNYQNKLRILSPKKTNTGKRRSLRVRRYNSISINNQNALLIKQIALFGPKKYLDLNIVKYLDKKQQKFMEDLEILNKNNQYRDSNEKERVFNFLIKNHLKKIVTKDLQYFNISINKYINYIIDYISLKEYGYLDIIYYDNDQPDNFYFLLNDSSVGEYTLNMISEDMSFENYFLYLYNLYKLYQKYKQKRDYLQKINKYETEEQKTFVDSHLIKAILDENDLVFPINSYNDVKDAIEIIIKAKIYNIILKIEKENANLEKEEINKKYIDEIIQIHKDYNVDINFLNFDKVVYEEIKSENYYTSFKNVIINDKSIMYYIKLLNNKTEYQIKKINYQKINNYHKFDYFGYFNYPLKNKEIITRKLIARSEKESTLVLCFNKMTYCNIISNLLNEENEKNMIYLHDEFIFKEINMEFFNKKIFSNFKLITKYKDDLVFNQDMDNRNLIMLKEGIIELQMKNISLFELRQKILSIRELLINKSKVYNMEHNELLKNVLKLEMDEKTSLRINIIKELIEKKINIIFSKYTRGSFGEYECFFNIPSLLTGIVFSESCEYYVYTFEKYKKLNINSYSLNDKLKKFAFHKLLNLLKRMFSIYNSYWKILITQYENDNNINEIEDSMNNNNLNNSNISGDINNNVIENININNNNNKTKDNTTFDPNQSTYKEETLKLNIPTPFNSHTLYSERLKETFNFSNTNFKKSKFFDPSKSSKFIFKNYDQANRSKEKKFKIKQWDFSWQEKLGKYTYSEKITNNLSNMALLKLGNDNKIKTSPRHNKKNDKISSLSKSNKIHKSKLYDIVLPPILKENNKNNDNYNMLQYFGLRSYKSKRNNTYNDRYFNNNENKKISEKKYLFTSFNKKIKKNNYDIKKVSINFLKSRRNKVNYFSNKDFNTSFGEYYNSEQ